MLVERIAALSSDVKMILQMLEAGGARRSGTPFKLSGPGDGAAYYDGTKTAQSAPSSPRYKRILRLG